MATVYLDAPSGNSNLRCVFSSGGQYLRAGNGVLEAYAAIADYRVAAAGSDSLTAGLARYRFTVPTPAVLPVSLEFSIHDIATDELLGAGVIHLDEDGAEIALPFYQPMAVQYPLGSYGEALSAARADGFGRLTLDTVAKKLRLLGHDDATVVREFDLDSATAPTSRT